MEHTPYKCSKTCKNPTCYYCSDYCGGLIYCTVCNGFEDSLTDKCCGKYLSDRWLNCFVRHGKYDYKNGQWVRSNGLSYKVVSQTDY